MRESRDNAAAFFETFLVRPFHPQLHLLRCGFANFTCNQFSSSCRRSFFTAGCSRWALHHLRECAPWKSLDPSQQDAKGVSIQADDCDRRQKGAEKVADSKESAKATTECKAESGVWVSHLPRSRDRKVRRQLPRPAFVQLRFAD